jgi:hypothetical protein
MAAGGLGALTATTPIGWVLPLLGWRGAFGGLALVAIVTALGIFSTPEKPRSAPHETLVEQLRGLASVFASRHFWRYAPQTTLLLGGFMAVQGLWAVPWLMRVDGMSRDAAAFHLLLTASAMLTGYLALAFFVAPLRRRGVPPERLLLVGTGIGVLANAAIVFNLLPSHIVWFLLGLVFSVGNLAYALLQTEFPAALSGRVNTALNLCAFAGAFGIQWGFGLSIDLLLAQGVPTTPAFQLTFGTLVALQATGYAWFARGRHMGSVTPPSR